MESLLMTLVTFIGLMLVLALAAQSVQEVIKAMFTIKGQTALRGLQGLISEAAAKEGQHASAANLIDAVQTRLKRLGQNGVRRGAVRLDSMSRELLASLISEADPSKIEGLRGIGRDEAECTLKRIADRTKEWYPLAMEPVDDRYRRRMRAYALLSSAIVVLGLNADAWTLLQRARTDPAFQAAVAADAIRLDSLSQRVERERAAVQAELNGLTAGGTGDVATRSPADTLTAPSRAQALLSTSDSLRRELARVVGRDNSVLFGTIGAFRWGDPTWWVGIVASILLVSLGAPFWHDVLEAVFGWKTKIRAQAKAATSDVPEEKSPSAAG